MIRAGLVAAVAVVLASACTDTSNRRCEQYVFTQGGGQTNHVASCGDPACGNGMNPPMAGPHCATTAPCRVHSTAVPRCSWIHNLEHGHVVLAYNCPEGCPEIVSELESIFAESPFPRRVIVTPDPLLPQKVAAVVWGYAYSSDTLDRDAVECLMELNQDREAPEAGLACSQ